MSPPASANLNLVKSISAAWERGDYGWVEWADADIEFVIADGPEPGRCLGLEGLAPSLLDFRSAWAEYRSEAVEYRELEDEGVLVLTNASGRGKASGAVTRGRRANLFRLRGGKVTSLVVYWSPELALADAGLAAGERLEAPTPDAVAWQSRLPRGSCQRQTALAA